jgi:glycerol kinase
MICKISYQDVYRSGLPLSTYFPAIKLRWMLDYYPEVSMAHESDDLLFGTVESWILYVNSVYSQ